MSPTVRQPSTVTAPGPTEAVTTTDSAPHQAIYRRWRAQTFAEIVGQSAVVETLRNAVRTGRVSHGILFVGPRGTGKTSLARILAKALNCTNLQDGDPCDRCPSCVAIREGRAMDLVEIDAASNRGIADIRELRDRIHYAPTDLRRKVYILDEAHQITKDAWNALLKSLEEPPDFVVFIFASTHPQEFPPAILSRLQRFDVRRLAVDEIEGKLDRILAAESVEAEPAAVHLIARLAAGGMRDAESMLDQVLASTGRRIEEASVRDLLGLAEADAVTRLADALVTGDAAAGIGVLTQLDERGRDVAIVLDQVIEQLRGELTTALGGGDPVRNAALSSAAHRLASIDPERRGVGGLRFQLELALLDAGTRATAAGTPVMSARAVESTRQATPATSTSASLPGTPLATPDSRAGGNAGRLSEQTAARPAGRSTPIDATPDARLAPERGAARTSDAEQAAGNGTSLRREKEPEQTTPAGPAEDDGPRAASARRTPSRAPAGADSTSDGTDNEAPPLAAGGDLPAAASGSNQAEVGIDRLRSAWPEIVAVLSQSPPVKPLIAACRPVSIDGPLVTLGFPEDQAFLKDALERRRPMLEEGIGRILGRQVNVRCVATNLEDVPPVVGEAADLISEARRIFGDDLVDVREVS